MKGGNVKKKKKSKKANKEKVFQTPNHAIFLSSGLQPKPTKQCHIFENIIILCG